MEKLLTQKKTCFHAVVFFKQKKVGNKFIPFSQYEMDNNMNGRKFYSSDKKPVVRANRFIDHITDHQFALGKLVGMITVDFVGRYFTAYIKDHNGKFIAKFVNDSIIMGNDVEYIEEGKNIIYKTNI